MKNSLPFYKRAIAWLGLVALVVNMGMVSLPIPYAKAATNVLLADTDYSFGLDGRDFIIDWTPANPSAPGFMNYEIYVLPEATVVDVDTIVNDACGGYPCMPAGMLMNEGENAYDLAQMQIQDSAGTSWSDSTSYKACILTRATVNTLDCSAGMTPVFDAGGQDDFGPGLDFMPVNYAAENQDASLYVRVFDEQTSPSDFANTSDGEQEYIKVFYGTNVKSASQSVDAVQVDGNLFSLTIPQAAISAFGGAKLEYYLEAKDRSGNTSVICSNTMAETANDCAETPFLLETIQGGSFSISGTIYGDNQTPSEGASIFVEGYAFPKVTSNGSGLYTIPSLPGNRGYDLRAFKSGYCDENRYVYLNGQNLSSEDIILFSGCQMGMVGDDLMVYYSMPGEGSQGVPVSTPDIRVIVSSSLNSSTVNDTNAADAGSNIYLTSDGSTKLPGTVKFCENSSAQGCNDIMDDNTIVFTPSSPLAPNTFYDLVITEGVTNETGNPIDGNRQPAGHMVSFMTGGSYDTQDIYNNFGQGGAYMPPYVDSSSPPPGMTIPRNSGIILKFSQPMDVSTLVPANIQLIGPNQQVVQTTVSPDAIGRETVTIKSTAAMAPGEHTIRVNGAVKNTDGICMIADCSVGSTAFESWFIADSLTDTQIPTLSPLLASGSTINVNESPILVGASERLNPSTVSTQSITMTRGTSSVPLSLEYWPQDNMIAIVPQTALSPNAIYNITFGTAITDMASNAITQTIVTYTTGNADQVDPMIVDGRCDDYFCSIEFSEAMMAGTQTSSNWANSILNHANLVLKEGSNQTDLLDDSVSINYDAIDRRLEIEGLNLTPNESFTFTATVAKDLAGNNIDAQGKTFQGIIGDSTKTFGSDGGGMFGPPTIGMGGAMGTMTPGSFAGGATADDMMFGQSNNAFPFNSMAGMDSNVFQVNFAPGQAIQDQDMFVFTFPAGTDVINTSVDEYSPFQSDFNMFGPGIVTFDTSFDSDGISVDTTNRKVTVKVDVQDGPTDGADLYTIDMRGIINPALAKGPDTAGYTLDMKLVRNGITLVNETSQPYYISAGGSRSITVNVYAGSAQSPINGANGSVYVFAGGPFGEMGKEITLSNGVISHVNGMSASSIQYTNLPDGCYFVGTDPYMTLGGQDYFGQSNPEPLCVDAQNTSIIKNIVLAAASSMDTAPLTVKLAGISNFGGADVEIFAGGPGTFMNKELKNLGTPDANGYTINLNSNGHWFIGVGPAMSKGGKGMATSLPGTPPPPVDLEVRDIDSTPVINLNNMGAHGVTFDANTNTLTFTFAAADKQIQGTITDGTTGLANVEVGVHSQGFGAPTFTTTNSSGQFTLNVSEYGTYELFAHKPGLGEVQRTIDLNPDGADAGSEIDIFYKGKQITNSNPLIITLKKPAYSISGKVLDSNSNGIGYAPIFAEDQNGNFVFGGTDSNGNYTVLVDAGTWTLRSELPPEKTDSCGTLSKEVTITNASKSNQNITLTNSVCFILSGTVSAGAQNLANTPLMVESWNIAENHPAFGGVFRPSSTDSSGNYQVKVPSGTYRVGTYHPDYGEIGGVVTVNGPVVYNISTGTPGVITFNFNGGTPAMEAFVEVNKADDQFTRKGEYKSGLNTNMTLNVKQGTYNYFVNVFGIGDFKGTVETGNTVNIDLSTSSLVTLSGNIKGSLGANLNGAMVTLNDNQGVLKTAVADSNGNYSLSVKPGTYMFSTSLAGYMPGESPKSIDLTVDTPNFDVGGSTPDVAAMQRAGYVIEGIVYQSDGTTPVSSGFVFGSNASGNNSGAPVDPVDGSYELPVGNGEWTLKAVAPLHAKTGLGSTVTVSGANVTGKNITLTADSTKISKSTSKSIGASTGGTINDMGNSGVKLTAGSGVLASSGDVTLRAGKQFTAPDTANFTPLGNATFSVTASSGSSSIKTLNGNAEIQLSYADLLSSIPLGKAEGDLKLAYYSPERGEYIPVEGGFTVDAVNNTVTGLVSHFTDFALVIATGESAPNTPTGLAGSAASTTQVNLTWTASSGATAYNIFRDTDPNGSFARIGTDPTVTGEVAYSDTGLTAGTTYYYKVSAINGTGESVASSAISVTTNSESTTTTLSTGGGSATISTTTSEDDEEEIVSEEEPVVEEATADEVEEIAVVTTVEESAEVEPISEGQETDPLALETPDYVGHWAEQYIVNIMDLGIANGIGENRFDPDTYLTRAQLTKMVVIAAGYDVPEVVESTSFYDVGTSDWYAPYIEVAKSAGLVEGYNNWYFLPNKAINRAEAVKILVESALGRKIALDPTQGMLANFGYETSPFEDLDVSEWYAKYVLYAHKYGIISGYADGTLGAENYMTRAEFAKIISIAMAL